MAISSIAFPYFLTFLLIHNMNESRSKKELMSPVRVCSLLALCVQLPLTLTGLTEAHTEKEDVP